MELLEKYEVEGDQYCKVYITYDDTTDKITFMACRDDGEDVKFTMNASDIVKFANCVSSIS